MTELEKLDAGLEYDFFDEGVNGRKLYAIDGCKRINSIDQKNEAELSAAISEFLEVQENLHGQGLDSSVTTEKKYMQEKNFTANYNVVILDIAPCILAMTA